MIKNNNNVVDTLIQLAGGSQQKLATIFGVSQQAVNKWRKNGAVPLDKAAFAYRFFNKKIPLWRLNSNLQGLRE